MTLKGYLIIMGFGTAIAWTTWGAVLYFINPEQAGIVGLPLFYLSLLLALTGTLALIGFIVRFRKQKDILPHDHVVLAYRQAISYSILMIIILILQSQRLLTWWNIILFVSAFALLELFLISLKHKRGRSS